MNILYRGLVKQAITLSELKDSSLQLRNLDQLNAWFESRKLASSIDGKTVIARTYLDIHQLEQSDKKAAVSKTHFTDESTAASPWMSHDLISKITA